MQARTTFRVINLMNSGYLSLIILCIVLILLLSGWKDVYLESISTRRVLLFFVGWLALVSFHLNLHGWQMNLVYLWVALLSIVILHQIPGFLHKLHLLSVGLLLGSILFLLQEVLTMDPVLVIFKPSLDAALLLALIVILIERRVKEQIASLSIGLLMGDFLLGFVHHSAAPVQFGGPSFQDEWWLSVFTARTMTILLETAYSGCKLVIRSWLSRRGGWRK
jgi:hypothetical protein